MAKYLVFLHTLILAVMSCGVYIDGKRYSCNEARNNGLCGSANTESGYLVADDCRSECELVAGSSRSRQLSGSYCPLIDNMNSTVNLNFTKGANLESGIANTVGSVYRFTDVSPGMDALFTLLDLHAIALQRYLEKSNGVGSFEAKLRGSDFGYIRMQVDLVVSGTSTRVAPLDLMVVSNDIDGQPGTNVTDFAEFFACNGVFTNDPTHLVGVGHNGNDAKFTNTDTGTNANEENPNYSAGAVYYNTASFVVTGGFESAKSIVQRKIVFEVSMTRLDDYVATTCVPLYPRPSTNTPTAAPLTRPSSSPATYQSSNAPSRSSSDFPSTVVVIGPTRSDQPFRAPVAAMSSTPLDLSTGSNREFSESPSPVSSIQPSDKFSSFNYPSGASQEPSSVQESSQFPSTRSSDQTPSLAEGWASVNPTFRPVRKDSSPPSTLASFSPEIEQSSMQTTSQPSTPTPSGSDQTFPIVSTPSSESTRLTTSIPTASATEGQFTLSVSNPYSGIREDVSFGSSAVPKAEHNITASEQSATSQTTPIETALYENLEEIPEATDMYEDELVAAKPGRDNSDGSLASASAFDYSILVDATEEDLQYAVERPSSIGSQYQDGTSSTPHNKGGTGFAYPSVVASQNTSRVLFPRSYYRMVNETIRVTLQWDGAMRVGKNEARQLLGLLDTWLDETYEQNSQPSKTSNVLTNNNVSEAPRIRSSLTFVSRGEQSITYLHRVQYTMDDKAGVVPPEMDDSWTVLTPYQLVRRPFETPFKHTIVEAGRSSDNSGGSGDVDNGEVRMLQKGNTWDTVNHTMEGSQSFDTLSFFEQAVRAAIPGMKTMHNLRVGATIVGGNFLQFKSNKYNDDKARCTLAIVLITFLSAMIVFAPHFCMNLYYDNHPVTLKESRERLLTTIPSSASLSGLSRVSSLSWDTDLEGPKE